MIKKILFLFITGLFVGFGSSNLSNINIGSEVELRNVQGNFFSCSNDRSINIALYDGQTVRNSVTVFGDQGHEYHYYNSSYATVNNPFSTIRTNESNLNIPPFLFRSQVLPRNRNLGQGVYLTIQDDTTYFKRNGSNRRNMVGQFVHYINEGRTNTFNGPNNNFIYRWDNGQFLSSPSLTHSSNANNIRPFNTPQNTCHDFYLARCGDGVIDNPNKPGGPNTDGKQGIQTTNGFISWFNPNFTYEVCDDGVNNGRPGFCNNSCDGFVDLPSPDPVCNNININPNPILPGQTTNITCSVSNAQYYVISITTPDGQTINGQVNSPFNYVANIGGQHTASCIAANADGSKTSRCEDKSITVTNDTPKCEGFSVSPNPVQINNPVSLVCQGNQYSSTYQIRVDRGTTTVADFAGTLTNQVASHSFVPNIAGNYTAWCAMINTRGEFDYCKQDFVAGNVDLRIEKNANQTRVASGGLIGFTINFGNRGTMPATGLTIGDILPDTLEYVSHNAVGIPGSTPFNTTDGTRNIVGYINVNLAPGQQGTMYITGRLLTANCESGTTNYVAIIKDGEIIVYDDANFNCIPIQPANLVLNKKQSVNGGTLTDSTVNVRSGDNIRYQITLTNNGGSPMTNIYLEDIMPVGVEHINNFISGIPGIRSSATLVGNQRVVSSSVFTLNPGQTVTMTINARIRRNEGSFLNTAYTREVGGRIINQDSVLATGIGPALTLSKDIVNPQQFYMPGDIIVYRIRFRNHGRDSARDIIIRDIIPYSVNFVDSSIDMNNAIFGRVASAGTDVIYYEGFDLAPGASVIMIITGTVKDNVVNGSNTLNLAVLNSSNHPPLNDTADFMSQSMPSITKYQRISGGQRSTGQITVNANDNIEYQVVFKNNGGVVANNVVVRDIMPAGMTLSNSTLDVNHTFTNVSTNANGQTVVVYSGITLNPGQEARLNITASISDASLVSYMNVAEVEFFNPYRIVRDSVVLSIVPFTANNVAFSKSIDDGSEYNLGDNINFNIQFTNLGPQAISDLVIEDVLPTCVDFISANPNRDNNTSYRWTIGTLGANQSRTITIVGRIKNTTNCVGDHINKAIANYTVGSNNYSLERNVNFNVQEPERNACGSLDALNSTVVILNTSNDRGSVSFQCRTANGQEANIRLDCGNGTTVQGFGSGLTHSCNYTQSNLGTNTVKCYVDDQTNAQCEQNVDVIRGSLGFCGDGKREGYEQCDITDIRYADGLTNNGRYIIGNRLDNGSTPAPARYRGTYCERCAIKGGGDDGTHIYEPPACFYSNTNMSVQKGEVLPYRWSLQKDVNNITEGNQCITANSIPRDTMMCNWAIYRDERGGPVHIRRSPCFQDGWSNNVYFNYFENAFPDSKTMAIGRYWINLWTDAIAPKIANHFGEYKLSLESVEYTYCDQNARHISNPQIIDRVCQVNFAVTRPYLVQKSAFSATPQTTTIDLRDFYSLNGDPIINRTDLSRIMVINENQYRSNIDTNTIMINFSDKYSQLAVEVPSALSSNLIGNNQIKVNKVPGQDIYIFEPISNTKRITLKSLGANFEKPFTIIIKGMDLVVQGSLTNTNGMFIVLGGKISFQEPEDNRCEARQEVNGVFITNIGFGVDDDKLLINNRFDNEWCNEGGLTIRGALLGQDLDKLVQQRRSNLNTWFHIDSSRNEFIQRREKIFQGAALLIEYNPALRNSMPPGMSELSQVLDVFRR